MEFVARARRCRIWRLGVTERMDAIAVCFVSFRSKGYCCFASCSLVVVGDGRNVDAPKERDLGEGENGRGWGMNGK